MDGRELIDPEPPEEPEVVRARVLEPPLEEVLLLEPPNTRLTAPMPRTSWEVRLLLELRTALETACPISRMVRAAPLEAGR
jgi:hypothetical protein